MSIINTIPSGNAPAVSDELVKPEQPQDNRVSYETYQKVLDEAKKAKEKARELEAFKKQTEEEKLKAEGNLQAIIKMREEELFKVREDKEQLERGLQDGSKLRAVLDSLNGRVDDAYYGLFDLSQIVIDPRTQLPDQMSVAKYARDFEAKYGLVIQKDTSSRLPNNAPQTGSASLTYEEWLKLPLKEQKTRLKEVINL
jgi:hypothetical protein